MAGWIPAQEPVTNPLAISTSTKEADLRDSGKWDTLRHHRVSFAVGGVNSARLERCYVARRAGALDGSPTEVPFAMLISVFDPAAAARYTVTRPQSSPRCGRRSGSPAGCECAAVNKAAGVSSGVRS